MLFAIDIDPGLQDLTAWLLKVHDDYEDEKNGSTPDGGGPAPASGNTISDSDSVDVGEMPTVTPWQSGFAAGIEIMGRVQLPLERHGLVTLELRDLDLKVKGLGGTTVMLSGFVDTLNLNAIPPVSNRVNFEWPRLADYPALWEAFRPYTPVRRLSEVTLNDALLSLPGAYDAVIACCLSTKAALNMVGSEKTWALLLDYVENCPARCLVRHEVERRRDQFYVRFGEPGADVGGRMFVLHDPEEADGALHVALLFTGREVAPHVCWISLPARDPVSGQPTDLEQSTAASVYDALVYTLSATDEVVFYAGGRSQGQARLLVQHTPRRAPLNDVDRDPFFCDAMDRFCDAVAASLRPALFNGLPAAALKEAQMGFTRHRRVREEVLSEEDLFRTRAEGILRFHYAPTTIPLVYSVCRRAGYAALLKLDAPTLARPELRDLAIFEPGPEPSLRYLPKRRPCLTDSEPETENWLGAAGVGVEDAPPGWAGDDGWAGAISVEELRESARKEALARARLGAEATLDRGAAPATVVDVVVDGVVNAQCCIVSGLEDGTAGEPCVFMVTVMDAANRVVLSDRVQIVLVFLLLSTGVEAAMRDPSQRLSWVREYELLSDAGVLGERTLSVNKCEPYRDVRWSCQYVQQGQYVVRATVQDPGAYALHVKANGLDVVGSPFKLFFRSAAPDPGASLVEGLGTLAQACFAPDVHQAVRRCLRNWREARDHKLSPALYRKFKADYLAVRPDRINTLRPVLRDRRGVQVSREYYRTSLLDVYLSSNATLLAPDDGSDTRPGTMRDSNAGLPDKENTGAKADNGSAKADNGGTGVGANSGAGSGQLCIDPTAVVRFKVELSLQQLELLNSWRTCEDVDLPKLGQLESVTVDVRLNGHSIGNCPAFVRVKNVERLLQWYVSCKPYLVLLAEVGERPGAEVGARAALGSHLERLATLAAPGRVAADASAWQREWLALRTAVRGGAGAAAAAERAGAAAALPMDGRSEVALAHLFINAMVITLAEEEGSDSAAAGTPTRGPDEAERSAVATTTATEALVGPREDRGRRNSTATEYTAVVGLSPETATDDFRTTIEPAVNVVAMTIREWYSTIVEPARTVNTPPVIT
ncbi:filamin/ABP280 repeat protein [Gregarina niphandrodes]|uniref:Filamin/ABP280 repeat protein n=1 Tax=Gregarina niphandrodes TaxID=110365 RepID=A0A023AX84_GRENI|nr:filamin/ABP280 repeat protein [Gregarina niphandrodes]EZG43341.1 filamin/ABP280 repeat protein [Gregarina niphandrodes]|eukprot:XP_011133390.1 filamin/ABP280 repeat protein [Gregarina niphandrodes]